MTTFFDSHTHLTADKFDEDRTESIQRAHDAGVRHLLGIGSGYGREGNLATVELAQATEGMWAAVGVHPHEASEYDADFADLLQQLVGRDKVVCVGEIGLDYFYDHAPRERQKEVFGAMCDLALQCGLPVSVHTRDAHDDTVAILKQKRIGQKIGGVIHCFTGNADQARDYLKLGFHISMSGIVTYKTAQELREALGIIPTERLLIETDAPYLAPVPKRGKRNEPAFVVHTAQRVADELSLALEDVARITDRNARDLFGLAGDPGARVAYTIRNSVYLNITNRCTLACTFCPKFRDWKVKGHFLELPAEPDLPTVMRELEEENWQQRDEVVFCGYGEPTQRLDFLLELAAKLKKTAPEMSIRLNTDGLGNLIHHRDILPDLSANIDVLAVSMNADNAAQYARFCPNPYGEDAWQAVQKFIRQAASSGPFSEVRASVVTMPGLNLESCQKLAESLGAVFRARELGIVG